MPRFRSRLKTISLLLTILYIGIICGSVSIYLMHDMAHLFIPVTHRHAGQIHSHTHGASKHNPHLYHVYVNEITAVEKKNFTDLDASGHQHNPIIETLLASIEPEPQNPGTHTLYVGQLYYHLAGGLMNMPVVLHENQKYTGYGSSIISAFTRVPPTPPPRFTAGIC